MVSGHDQHPGGDRLITGVGGRPGVRGTRLIPAASARMSSRPAAMSRGSAIDSATSTIRGDGASHLTAVVDQRYRGPPVECAEAMADSKRPHLAQTDLKCNSRRFVFGDDRQRAAQLLKHHGLRLDAIALLQPDIASRQAPQRSASVLRQHHLEHLRANRVAAPSDIEGKLSSQRANAPGTGTLPLRPHQTQV